MKKVWKMQSISFTNLNNSQKRNAQATFGSRIKTEFFVPEKTVRKFENDGFDLLIKSKAKVISSPEHEGAYGLFRVILGRTGEEKPEKFSTAMTLFHTKTTDFDQNGAPIFDTAKIKKFFKKLNHKNTIKKAYEAGVLEPYEKPRPKAKGFFPTPQATPEHSLEENSFQQRLLENAFESVTPQRTKKIELPKNQAPFMIEGNTSQYVPFDDVKDFHHKKTFSHEASENLNNGRNATPPSLLRPAANNNEEAWNEFFKKHDVVEVNPEPAQNVASRGASAIPSGVNISPEVSEIMDKVQNPFVEQLLTNGKEHLALYLKNDTIKSSKNPQMSAPVVKLVLENTNTKTAQDLALALPSGIDQKTGEPIFNYSKIENFLYTLTPQSFDKL